MKTFYINKDEKGILVKEYKDKIQVSIDNNIQLPIDPDIEISYLNDTDFFIKIGRKIIIRIDIQKYMGIIPTIDYINNNPNCKRKHNKISIDEVISNLKNAQFSSLVPIDTKFKDYEIDFGWMYKTDKETIKLLDLYNIKYPDNTEII